MRWTSLNRVILIAGAAASTLLVMMGCGAPVPVLPRTHTPASVSFVGWEPGTGGNYVGRLHNSGLVARNVRVELWYANAAAESARIVVPLQADIEELHPGFFHASPQISNGESRYPRVGTIAWDGGSSPGAPRKPSITFAGFFCHGTDSLIGEVSNVGGGWAYHISVTLEDRNGVRTIATNPDPLGPIWTGFTCVPRDSSGVRLPPRVLLIRWEDYGGIPDSLVMPAVADTLPPICR